jgi:hypothetical protein
MNLQSLRKDAATSARDPKRNWNQDLAKERWIRDRSRQCQCQTGRRGEKSYNRRKRGRGLREALVVYTQPCIPCNPGERHCRWSTGWPEAKSVKKGGEARNAAEKRLGNERLVAIGLGRDDEKCGGLFNAAACSQSREPRQGVGAKAGAAGRRWLSIGQKWILRLRCCMVLHDTLL